MLKNYLTKLRGRTITGLPKLYIFIIMIFSFPCLEKRKKILLDSLLPKKLVLVKTTEANKLKAKQIYHLIILFVT